MSHDYASHRASPMEGERRSDPRYRTFFAGRILGDKGEPILCVVRDMSRGGARLVVDPAALLPVQFTLHLISTGQTLRAELVWRRADLAGVRLIGPDTRDA